MYEDQLKVRRCSKRLSNSRLSPAISLIDATPPCISQRSSDVSSPRKCIKHISSTKQTKHKERLGRVIAMVQPIQSRKRSISEPRFSERENVHVTQKSFSPPVGPSHCLLDRVRSQGNGSPTVYLSKRKISKVLMMLHPHNNPPKAEHQDTAPVQRLNKRVQTFSMNHTPQYIHSIHSTFIVPSFTRNGTLSNETRSKLLAMFNPVKQTNLSSSANKTATKKLAKDITSKDDLHTETKRGTRSRSFPQSPIQPKVGTLQPKNKKLPKNKTIPVNEKLAKVGTLTRKKQLRSKLKAPICAKSVLDCTPLKGLKPAAGLAFLDQLSPMSFGTPEQKAKKGGYTLRKVPLKKLTPTNRGITDRYILELSRRHKAAEINSVSVEKPCSSSKLKDKVFDDFKENESNCNLSTVFAKNNQPDSDEEEKDEYFNEQD